MSKPPKLPLSQIHLVANFNPEETFGDRDNKDKDTVGASVRSYNMQI